MFTVKQKIKYLRAFGDTHTTACCLFLPKLPIFEPPDRKYLCQKKLSCPYPFTVLTWVRVRTKNRAFGCHPGIWSKFNFSNKITYEIKAELIIVLLHYLAGVDSTSSPRSSGGKLSKVESLVAFGRWSSLPKIYPS